MKRVNFVPSICFDVAFNLFIKVTLKFFLNWAELLLNLVNSANSRNLINHWSMNWAQFKHPVSHMCLAGTVVASYKRGGRYEPFYFNDKYFCHIRWIQWKHLGKTPLSECYQISSKVQKLKKLLDYLKWSQNTKANTEKWSLPVNVPDISE